MRHSRPFNFGIYFLTWKARSDIIDYLFRISARKSILLYLKRTTGAGCVAQNFESFGNMEKFEFHFEYASSIYTGECTVFPIDGTSELHIIPRDPDIYEKFGKKILMLHSDGSITTTMAGSGDEKKYVMSLAEGVADFYNNQQDIN